MADDDDEDFFYSEDVLLGLLVLAAPPEVLSSIITTVRKHVSVKAGDEVNEDIKAVRGAFLLPSEFVKEAKKNLAPELRGPVQGEVEQPAEAAGIPSLFQMLARGQGVSPEGYLLPTPGCNCPGCTRVNALAKQGIRIKAATGEEVKVDDKNNLH